MTFDPYETWLKIAPQERPIHHYRLLGIALFENDSNVIQAAADERMRHVRTFQTGARAEHSQRLMTELAQAKLCLLDADTKATYDAVLQGKVASQPAIQPPPLAASQPPPVAKPQTESTAEPPVVSPPAATVGHAEEPDDLSDRPFYFQPWFPVVLVASAMLFAFGAWGIVAAITSRDAEVVNAPPVEPTVVENPEVETPTDHLPVDDAVVIMQEAGGQVNLSAGTAVLEGFPRLIVRDGTNEIIDITSTDDRLTWHFQVEKAAAFRIEATYATTSAAAGGQFKLQTETESTKSLSTRDTGGPNSFTSERIGFIWLRRAGTHQLTLVPESIPEGNSLMTLRTLRLVPVTGTDVQR